MEMAVPDVDMTDGYRLTELLVQVQTTKIFIVSCQF